MTKKTFGIILKSKPLGLSTVNDWQAYRFKVTLSKDKSYGYGDAFTTDYSMGTGHAKDSQAPMPQLAEVLYSLQSDAQAGEHGFDEFCADLGYDSDSIKALKIHKACVKIRAQLATLLGTDFDAFMSH